MFVHLIYSGSTAHLRLEIVLANCASDVATTAFEFCSSIRVINMWNSSSVGQVEFSSFPSFKRTVDHTDLTPLLSCYCE